MKRAAITVFQTEKGRDLKHFLKNRPAALWKRNLRRDENLSRRPSGKQYNDPSNHEAGVSLGQQGCGLIPSIV